MKINCNEKITLWGVKASPYVRRVMLALVEKQLTYELKEILPISILKALQKPIPDEFEKISPLGKIPVLQINNFHIADSAVISAYLDRKFSTGTQLYPTNPEAYANTLWFEHYADTTLTDVIYKKIFMENVIKPALLNIPCDKKILEQAQSIELPPLLDYLNEAASKNTWIAGSEFTIADIAITVQLLALQTAGFNLSDEKWFDLNHYLNKVINRPSFKEIGISTNKL